MGAIYVVGYNVQCDILENKVAVVIKRLYWMIFYLYKLNIDV